MSYLNKQLSIKLRVTTKTDKQVIDQNDEWSLLMLKALMTVIVDQLPFFKMISTSKEGPVV